MLQFLHPSRLWSLVVQARGDSLGGLRETFTFTFYALSHDSLCVFVQEPRTYTTRNMHV